MPADLTAFFAPRGVAVVGASRDPSKVGGSVLANLRAAGFEGAIVPVNAGAVTVQGLPAVPSLRSAPGPIDLAVIAVPADAVLPALQDCVAAGIPGAVVISAGFREAGEAGRAREARLRGWLAGHPPIRVLGPNCLGWIRPARRLNATFAPGMPLPGGIAFVSHSGALAAAILDWARERRLGFSLFATLGNQADLDESDILAAAAADPETRVIAAYLEGVADGTRFRRSLAEATALKPVVILKTGRTAAGARAVSSHTGALAGSDRAFEACVRQAGAVRVGSVEALFDLARALATQPPARGRRLLVVTNGGGLGVVAADAARDAGLVVDTLPADTVERLRAVLPATASLANPIDLVGDADARRYASALGAVGPAGGADLALVLLTAQAATDATGVARAVLGATHGWPIPLAAAFVGGARVAPGARMLEEGGVPCYAFPEPAVAALAGLAAVAERRRLADSNQAGSARPDAVPQPVLPTGAGRRPDLVAELHLAGRTGLGLTDLGRLLGAYGIPVVPSRLAATPAAAAQAAAELGGPVALKIVSPDVSHKTDVGGVRIGLPAERVVQEAEAMLERVRVACPTARLEGFLVQTMAPPGQELLVGVVRDEQFGPLVTVGFGGVYVEVLHDTAVSLVPVSPDDADRMLDELRLGPVLRGVRGQPPVDRGALIAVIVALGRLAVDWPDLVELELNPLVATPLGVQAVDARATFTREDDAAAATAEHRGDPRLPAC